MKHLSRTVLTVSTLTIFASVAFLGFSRSSTIWANNNQPISKTTGQPINAYGDFSVIIGDNFDAKTGTFTTSLTSYQVVINGTAYPAIVPANTRRHYSKRNIPIQGTLDNGTITLDEEPFRALKPREYSAKGVDASRLGARGVASEIGGVIEYFSDPVSFQMQLNQQIEWESKIGPESGSLSPWTEGTKTFLFIRIKCLDDTEDPPSTNTEILNLMNTYVSPYFSSASFNKTSIQTTVTPIFTLPNNRSYYDNNYNALLTDGRIVARANGYETNDYNLDAVSFPGTVTNFCGVSNAAGCAIIGQKGIWFAGSGISARIFAHELGHSYGLSHAKSWMSNDTNPIGAGQSIEYGDSFDVMGMGYPQDHHDFNAANKRRLDWLSEGNIRTVTADGTYRVHAFDNTNEGGIRALKLRANDVKDYWLSRREALNHPNLDNGIQFHWLDNATSTNLLDMNTPGNNSLGDAALEVGQVFSDPGSEIGERIRFSVLNEGELPQTLSVKVEFNVGCTYSVPALPGSFGASGGEGSILVTTQTGCAPPTFDNAKWIDVIETSKWIDSATIRYLVQPNYGAARNGIINVGGQQFTVTQSAQATACVAAPSGIVGWWQGEGNVLDQTGRNGGMVVYNLATAFSGGKIGGTFRTLDTNFGVVSSGPIGFVPDSSSLALTSSLSIEGWTKINNTAPDFASIIRRSNITGSTHPSYAVDFDSGKISFLINSNSDPNMSTSASVNSSAIPVNQFVHFAATLDNATGDMKLYINGALVDQKATSVRPFQTLTNVGGILIGTASTTYDYSMDELTVYNRSLSLAEVQSIYNAGIAPAGAGGKCPLSKVDKTSFDFDGDRKSDVSIYDRLLHQGVWKILGTCAGYSQLEFGLAGDKVVPADYDNDGRTDIAVYRNGTWYLQRSSAGYAQIQWGLTDDIPQPADFNGDGRAELTVYRPSNGTWYAYDLATGLYTIVQFGISTDKPAVGDYDGDGFADHAVYRPSEGIWYLLRSTAGFGAFYFGIAADHTVPADYDGDGKTDIAVFRPTTSVWYILRSTDFGVTEKQFGQASDYPAPADYDGDGKTDIAVWREGTGFKKGEWSILQSSSNQSKLEYHGNPGDFPVPTAFTSFSF